MIYCGNGPKVAAKDLRISPKADEQGGKERSLRKSWSQYHNCMKRQMDLIFDATSRIRKSFGARLISPGIV